jgi:hypothetical protein
MPFTEVCLPLQALCAATVNGHEDGDALITASDGESRTIKAGDVIAPGTWSGARTTVCSSRSTEWPA